jgi:hydroxyacylglutathione hydrolase
MNDVLHVCAFEDNYIWLIRGTSPDRVLIVDPGDARPVLEALEKQRLTPIAILCTHHHGDHVGGIEDILKHYPVPVYGPAQERIPAITHRLREGDSLHFPELGLTLDVLDVPGHTSGHIAYYGAGMLFCGDTLFSAGCGKLFEGTAEQMHASLAKLARLPRATKMYCAHEYTEFCLGFAHIVEPDNEDIHAYRAWARAQRAQYLPTLPSTLEQEQRINPFLRTNQISVRQAAEKQAHRSLPAGVDVFTEVRRWMDSYKG